MMQTQKSPLPKLHAVKGTATMFVAGNRPVHFERGPNVACESALRQAVVCLTRRAESAIVSEWRRQLIEGHHADLVFGTAHHGSQARHKHRPGRLQEGGANVGT